MRKCPECGARYDIGDAICAECGAELPAPYEEAPAEEDVAEAVQAGEEVITGEEMIKQLLASLRANMAPAEITILSGATLYLEEGVVDSGSLVIAGGRIVDVFRGEIADPQDGTRHIDLAGYLLAPGFIDIHVHGMMGIDTNGASPEDFLRISAEAAKHGTTALAPTTVACSEEELGVTLENLRQAREQGFPGARLLGLHLESNFISPDFKGAQPPEQIFSPLDPKADAIKALIDEFSDEIRIITLAPEIPGVLDLIPWLTERGIIASLGHSSANYDQAIAGIEAGATHATHLFNAMPPIHHRNPGLVGAALERDEVFTEMVCDGVHIHPAVISVAISAKGAERFMPISDGLQGAGMEEGEFFLGGQHVTVKDGVARLDSGTIAGSITTMDRIVRLLVERVGWDLAEALYMASTTPANGLGLDILGRIRPGVEADLVVLDPDLTVRATLVAGRVVYNAFK